MLGSILDQHNKVSYNRIGNFTKSSNNNYYKVHSNKFYNAAKHLTAMYKNISPHTGYCQGGPFADRTCNYNSAYDTNTDCMDTTLECGNSLCSAFFNTVTRLCIFNTYIGVGLVSEPIRCCFCNNTNDLWWDCGDNTSTVSPSLTSLSPSLSNGEYNYTTGVNPVSANLIGLYLTYFISESTIEALCTRTVIKFLHKQTQLKAQLS